MNAPAISIRNVSKRYRNGVLANNDISLAVPGGELLALLGPNGSGKTTLVRQITTEMRPSSGAIEIVGIDSLRHPHRVKELIGVVPQEAGLFEHLTVEQHLLYFALFRGMNRVTAKESVHRCINELILSEHRTSVIKDLSGGLKRRMMIAIALLSEPPILVLDEPTAGMDPESRRALWSVLLERKRSGTTIILTTHYLEEAEVLADRVAVLSHGKLIADQPAEDLAEVYFRLVEERL